MLGQSLDETAGVDSFGTGDVVLPFQIGFPSLNENFGEVGCQDGS